MTPTHRVLLVEDDRLIAKTLKMSLQYKGFDLTVCETFQDGLQTFKSKSFDVVLLDVNLPDGNGLELCRQIRALNESVPVLMLTAKTDEESAVEGLEGGADDYIRKPYGVQELVVRINRIMDRRKSSKGALRFGPLRIDLSKRMAWGQDKVIALGKREFEILALLIKKAGDAVTRNEILSALDEDSEIYDRTIDSHLSHLRKKLKDAGVSEVQIVPIYGVGYRLEEK